MRFIGDIHGKTQKYWSTALRDYDGPSVQVGDFGIGFKGPRWHGDIREFQRANPQHRFIRGNHDNPERCKEFPGFIPDGTVEGDVMYLGGAWSIDWAHRTEGVNWWADEECSEEQLAELVDRYKATKPRVMVTHDAPLVATREMFLKEGNNFGTFQKHTRTGAALQAMFEVHQPEHWVFGHWHQTKQLSLKGTTFQCLGELDYIDLEV